MKKIKVDKVILYYMDRVDPDGNPYRFYVYKGMASEIEYFCTEEAGNMTIPIGEGEYVKIAPKEIEKIPVRGYRKNGIIFELEEKSKYTGRYMDGEISYNNTSIDYTKEIRECDRKSEIKDLLNDPCLGKIFEKGEVDDEIIYNGNIEDVKEEWMRAIQNGVDKMNVNKDMNGHNLIYVIKYGICRYAYRICIDSYPGYVVKDPITLIEWVQGLKPGTVIKIRGIFIYHFL